MDINGITTAVVLVARVYYGDRISAPEMRAAQAEAQRILREAGIDAHWTECSTRQATPVEAATACSRPLRLDELVLRFVSGGPTQSFRSAPLGDSMVNPATAAHPVLATLYVDRTRWMADRAGVDRRLLLGRVVAHEIGHLLLNTSAHTEHGLMRATWTLADVRRDGAADWRFITSQAETMRAALTSRVVGGGRFAVREQADDSGAHERRSLHASRAPRRRSHSRSCSRRAWPSSAHWRASPGGSDLARSRQVRGTFTLRGAFPF